VTKEEALEKMLSSQLRKQEHATFRTILCHKFDLIIREKEDIIQ
jgi:hypothetical protein